jgi:hypothetical protein
VASFRRPRKSIEIKFVFYRVRGWVDTYTYIIIVGIHMYELNHSAHEGISRGWCNRFWFEESETSFRLLKINRIEGCLFVGVNIYILNWKSGSPLFFISSLLNIQGSRSVCALVHFLSNSQNDKHILYYLRIHNI